MNSGFLAKRARAGELSEGAIVEVDRLSEAATRSALAVQKLLDVARYSTGRVPPERYPTTIGPLVNETIDLLQDRIGSSGCRVRAEVSRNIPTLLCDGQGLHQVLFNLLTNAIDASGNGDEVVVTASFSSDILVLEVADNGSGMPPDVVQRATEPFFTTKAPGQGTGLGLSISESIVQRHGGTIEFRSTGRCGTTVHVEIPAQRAT